MDRFKPLRSSPQTKPSKPHTGSSHATSSDPLPDELQQLSDSEVELLDAVVQRAGPSATTFLTVFKAYSEVLTDKGLDPHETVFYTKLLKLGTMKGRNWGDKWERVKSERGKVGTWLVKRLDLVLILSEESDNKEDNESAKACSSAIDSI